jgi:hypothetical protein
MIRLAFFLALCVAALAACGKRAEGVSPSSNAGVKVERLFTTDGCTVYRFEDYGHYRYFVRCEGGMSHTQWQEGSGKTTRPTGIPTAEVQ